MAAVPVEIVRSAYEAFARGDIPAVLGVMDENVEWVESSACGIPVRGVHVGPGQVAEHVFAVVPTVWESFHIIPEDFFSDGDTVVARGGSMRPHEARGDR